MVIASFGDGRNLFGEGKMFIKDESKVASRVGGVKWGVMYLVKLLSESNNTLDLVLTSQENMI